MFFTEMICRQRRRLSGQCRHWRDLPDYGGRMGAKPVFGDGAAAALSVSLGRGETKDIHRSVGSAVLGSFLSGVVVIAIAYLWGE